MKRWLVLAATIGFSVSCISKHKVADAPPTPAAAQEKVHDGFHAAAEAPSAPPPVVEKVTAMEVSAAPLDEPLKKKPAGVDAKQSLAWLQHGNQRFVKNHLRKDGQSLKDVKRVAEGQHPHAIVLACSDSRVPPEIVFDQKLGEIFVVRTAGEALDLNVVATIEYAVQNLGTRLLIIMGHTACGAVQAALDTPPGTDTGSRAMNALVADLHARLKSVDAKNRSEDLSRESWANAAGIAEDLQKASPILKAAVDQGELTIQPALYHLNSGEVTFE